MSLATLNVDELRLSQEIRRRADKRAKTRKRFLVASLAVLLVVGAGLGVSFLGSTGATTLTINGNTNASASNFVYTSGSSTAPPEQLVESTTTTFQPASWSPVAGSAGSVTTAGDLAFFDASAVSDGMDVSAYITNLSALQSDYSSFALPVQVWYLASVTTAASTSTSPVLGAPATACAAVTTAANATTAQSSSGPGDCVWELADGSVPSDGATGSTAGPNVLPSSSYITNDSGSLQLNLPQPGFYELTMATGGSYYCTSTSGTLGPNFFYTATAY